MKKLTFFCAFLALASAKPNGYFHQEYSYKSSSSSYKNNELQHKKDDQGFYSKDGDLEGRVKPKVNSQSQHTEYTNPKLLSTSGGYQSAGFSNGANYMAGSDRLYGGVGGMQGAGGVDGYASSDRVLDLSNVYRGQGYGTNQGLATLQTGGYGGVGTNYGYTQGGSSYGYTQRGSSQSTSGSYANLNALMQRLQDDMTRQLEHAIYNQYQSSGYTTSVTNNQINSDIRLLEEELKRNLTRQLQDTLRTQYGTNTYQTAESRPSYSTQDLAALTRRLEDDLVTKLHQSVRTTYNRESSNTYRPVLVYPVTTSRTYYDVTTPRYTQIYPGQLNVIRYTPVPNPESLTQIASKTQTEINSNLDLALQNLYSAYLQADRTSYYTMTDFENEVSRIRDEITRNLTYNLDDQIRRNYGQQVLKNDYYYTMSSNGDLSAQSNYNLRDYENLKKQVEDNLLRKLEQTVSTYREQYRQRQTQSVTYRPAYYTSGNQRYDYSDLQRQMSQQLQNALNQRRYAQSSSYSASYNPQDYQTSLDELSRELQRNLTEQLGSYRASSSSSSSYGYSSGSGGNADFESMKNQLQNQLMQQLRQGLQNQRHYSASASYSASSSHSANANYGMRQTYGSYPTTCLNGCGKRRRRDLYDSGSNNNNKRHGVKSVRRFYSSSHRYLQHPEDLSYPPQSIGSKRHQELEPDIVEDLGLTNHQTTQLEQKPYTIKYGKQNELTQQLEETQPLQDDLSQQLELRHPTVQKIYKFSGKLESDSSQKLEITTQQQNHKLRRYEQELEGQLTLNSPNFGQHLENQNKLGDYQKPDQEILGQQLEDQNFNGHLHKPRKNDQELEGQLNIDQKQGQQLEDQNLIGNLHGPRRNIDQELEGQQTLRQQLEDQNFRGNLHGPRRNIDQNIEGQQTLGQQLGNQNFRGNLHGPRRNIDQELEGQLTLGQHWEDQNLIGNLHGPRRNIDQNIEGQLTLGQQLESQNFRGNLHGPRRNIDQELEGQLTLGQQLENQNLRGNLHGPKRNIDQELEGQQTLGQQLENQNFRGNLHGPRRNIDQELEGQLTLGQHLEDQNLIGNLHGPRRNIDQNIEGQLTLGQQLEDQNFRGNLHGPKRNIDQELEGQETLGQQLEDQNLIGNLHGPRRKNDQELESQLSIEQQGQQLEDQNSKGHLHKPRNNDQELEGQLNIDQKTSGQELEDQNLLGNLQSPKQTLEDQNTYGRPSLGEQEIEGQLSLGLEDTTKPKHYRQDLEDKLSLEQQSVGQQLEDQNLRKPKRKHNFQNQLELTQQLEQEEPKLFLRQQSRLELEAVPQKRTNPYGNSEGSDQLIQQLEIIGSGKPKQQSAIELQSPDQQISDLSQQLELTNPIHTKPAVVQLELKPQIEDEDDLQRLELGAKPKYAQTAQQPDDLTQQLELEAPIYGKTKPDQQLQNQENVEQNLELSGTGLNPEQRQVDSPIFLQSVPKNTDQEVQGQTDDLTQQLEDLEKPRRQNQEQLVLINPKKPKLNEGQQQIEEDLTLDHPAQLDQTNSKISVQELETTVRTTGLEQQELLTDQRLEEPEQKLELDGLSQTNLKPQQTIVDQEGLSQQLELGDVQKPHRVNFGDGQQLEQDFTPLELDGGRKPKTNHQYLPTLESDLSLTPEKAGNYHSEGNFRQHSSITSQSKHYPSQTFGNYGSYRQESEQRSFTNGHSGHFTTNTFPSLGSQVRVDSYENTLRQQDALMDLLKKKVEDLSSTQGVYGKRTIKKTVFINGKPVETQESSQLIKPNGEVVDLKGPSPSKSVYSTTFGGDSSSQSTDCFGKNLGTYHITGPTYSGKSQLSTQSLTFVKDPSSLFKIDFPKGGFQRESEFSGKSTRRVVHYVNGKPVSASEKIQILKPNGEVIEKNHDLPTDQLKPLSHGFPDKKFEIMHSLDTPQAHISRQNEGTSLIEDSSSRNQLLSQKYSFGTKTSRYLEV